MQQPYNFELDRTLGLNSRLGPIRNLCLTLLVFFCVACSNTPLYDIDESMADASERAGSSDPDDRTIYAGRPSSVGTDTDDSGDWFVESEYQEDSFGSSDFLTFDQHRFLFGRTQTINLGVSSYLRNDGYSLAYSARLDQGQVAFKVFFSDIHFNRSEVSNLEQPWLIGFNMDFQALLPLGPMFLESGVRMEWGSINYEFLQPLTISGTEYDGDALSYFGLGVPSGVQMTKGLFSVEATATPMLLFHYGDTTLGFDNSLGSLKLQVPLALQVGIAF